MLILTIIAAIGCMILGTVIDRNKKYLKEEREHVEFFQEVIDGKMPFKNRNKSSFFSTANYLAENAKYQLYVDITRREISCQLLKIGREYSRPVYTFNYNKKEDKFKNVKIDDKFSSRNPEIVQKFTDYLMERFKDENIQEESKPLSQKMREIIARRQQTKPVEKAKEKRLPEVLEKEVAKIKELYQLIQSFQDGLLDSEDKHNINRLYNGDLKKLIESYLSMDEKGMKEEERMKESLDLIYQKLEVYKERISKQKKFQFEKITETIRVRK